MIECYVREGLSLKLRLPKGIDDVEQYLWEAGLPDLKKSRERGFHNLNREGPFYSVFRQDFK